ncbi:MAG: hypothetical protein IPM54_22285 [Polyangiaceae bacterium]|nr:hypothetical protein [Polyangiaceae bacterium]
MIVRTRKNAWLTALVLGASMTAAPMTSASIPLLGDLDRATRARNATVEMDYPAARSILEGADASDTALALERGHLFIYEGDCDAAATIFARPDLVNRPEALHLAEVARGCARSMAGTVTVEEEGVRVRLQDDDDRALVPLIVDTALRTRTMLTKELGVELPLPIHVDLVRDQFALSAMTGLPEQAARTTGTVAVAKWGRVTMLSPRATSGNYAWLDTLAHEMTHLALSRGTRDKAPLWLQEGVAKRQQTRWRDGEPLDDFPPDDAVARIGMERGLGVELDKIGPSIAMLPSAERASVAYAEVASFIRYWAREAGDEALPQLVVRLKEAKEPDDVGRAISAVSSADFVTWVSRWKAHLTSVQTNMPADLEPGARPSFGKDAARRVRLGTLLQNRSHAKAASIERTKAHAAAPFDANVRCALAESFVAMGEKQNAASLVERIEDVHYRVGRWHSLRGLLFPDASDVDRQFRMGISLDPMEPLVACEEKTSPELPKDPLRAAICEMARRVPR